MMKRNFKTDFDKYLIENEICTVVFTDGDSIIMFHDFPFLMQQGVILKFLEENNIYIGRKSPFVNSYWVCDKTLNITYYLDIFEAIEKGKELYNENTK